MKEFFNRLKKDFADKAYAHSYMESHAVSRIAAQIHALRKQRGLSQEELAAQTGIAQERISKIESADFESLTMKTLYKFSKAFDVYLHVSFEPFSRGILDVANLNREQLEVKNRDEDLASNFTENTIFVCSNGEWKAVNHFHIVAGTTYATQPIRITDKIDDTWLSLGVPQTSIPQKIAMHSTHH